MTSLADFKSAHSDKPHCSIYTSCSYFDFQLYSKPFLRILSVKRNNGLAESIASPVACNDLYSRSFRVHTRKNPFSDQSRTRHDDIVLLHTHFLLPSVSEDSPGFQSSNFVHGSQSLADANKRSSALSLCSTIDSCYPKAWPLLLYLWAGRLNNAVSFSSLCSVRQTSRPSRVVDNYQINYIVKYVESADTVFLGLRKSLCVCRGSKC